METPPEDHSFAPANHKLISTYLRRRVAGDLLPPATAAHFHDVDIYAAEPATLTAGLQPAPAGKGEARFWLLFTPLRSKSSTDIRRSRRVGGGLGTWHSEHAPEAVVDDDGNRVGHRQLFSYKDKGGRRSGWSMWEFSAEDQDQEGGESTLVLCKIHRAHAGSRRGAGGSAARSTRKRKGTDGEGADQDSAAPVRRRLFPPPDPTPPVASQDKIGAVSEAIPCSRTESVLSFWDEPATSQGKISGSPAFLPRFSTEPVAPQENTLSTTMESPAGFLIPELEASQAKTTEPDHGFVMANGAPLTDEYEASFMDGVGDMSGWSLCASGSAGISGSWTGHDATPSCSGGNPFLGGLQTYDEFSAGAAGSWNGYNTTASWSDNNAFVGGLPTYDEWGISGSAASTVQYGCSMPSSTFLPSAAPSQWCGGPSSWSC